MLAAPAPDRRRARYGYLKKICRDRPSHRRLRGQHPPAQAGRRPFHEDGGKVREQPFQARAPDDRRTARDGQLIGSWQPERLRAGRDRCSLRHPAAPRPGSSTQHARICRSWVPTTAARASRSSWRSPITSPTWRRHGASTWSSSTARSWSSATTRASASTSSAPRSSHASTPTVRDRRGARMRYAAGIVLDMVGGRNLRIKQEPNSLDAAPRAGARGLGRRATRCAVNSFRPDGPRGHGRPPRPEQRRHPDDRHHRLRLSVLAQGRRPARELLGRKPGRSRPGGHGLACPAPTPDAPLAVARRFGVSATQSSRSTRISARASSSPDQIASPPSRRGTAEGHRERSASRDCETPRAPCTSSINGSSSCRTVGRLVLNPLLESHQLRLGNGPTAVEPFSSGIVISHGCTSSMCWCSILARKMEKSGRSTKLIWLKRSSWYCR